VEYGIRTVENVVVLDSVQDGVVKCIGNVYYFVIPYFIYLC